MISDLKNGTRIEGEVFLVADSKCGVGNTGKRYLSVSLQDASGDIEGKKWEIGPHDEEIFSKGNLVMIQGDVLSYKDQLQLKIYEASPVSQEGVDWSLFVANAPVAKEEMVLKLKDYLNSIKDEDVKTLVCESLKGYKEKFLSWPAASKNHHNYVGGLLYHSLTMADAALVLSKVYPSLNRDVLLGGVLLHDLGKTIELSGPQATVYTLEGKLLGHLAIGASIVREVGERLGYDAYKSLKEDVSEEEKQKAFHRYEIWVCFQHILLSHHGKPEFGSAVMPLTREALAVSMIDDFDAKMMILDKSYSALQKGEYTPRLFTMDERYFYYPHYSPEMKNPGLSKEEEEALLK
ncbi:HD domain-containing protein [bacterium]|nr:HD domain-containing protein [bacterium]